MDGANTQPACTDEALSAYVAGRSRMAQKVLERLGAGSGSARMARKQALHMLPDLLWSDSWADAHGVPQEIFPSAHKYRRYAVGSGPAKEMPVKVERVGAYSRLQTTTNWVLDLRPYQDASDYFEQLSKSMKKKLKRYVNGAERWGLRLEPIRNEAQMERFLHVFAGQFPGSDWESSNRRALHEVYTFFEESGRTRSLLMVDGQGVDAVAALGYYTDRSFNLHLLARQDSALDFLSPGYCATFALIRDVIEEKRADFFFFGPGHFEYKERFLGRAMPIYRYEAHRWSNWPGLLKLYNRARKKEKRR